MQLPNMYSCPFLRFLCLKYLLLVGCCNRNFNKDSKESRQTFFISRFSYYSRVVVFLWIFGIIISLSILYCGINIRRIRWYSIIVRANTRCTNVISRINFSCPDEMRDRGVGCLGKLGSALFVEFSFSTRILESIRCCVICNILSACLEI